MKTTTAGCPIRYAGFIGGWWDIRAEARTVLPHGVQQTAVLHYGFAFGRHGRKLWIHVNRNVVRSIVDAP